MTRVACRRYHEQTRAAGVLRRLREFVCEIARFVVAASRYVDDANVELLAMADHPANPTLYVLVTHARRHPNLHEHEVGLGCDGAIEPARQKSVSRGDHRGHHSVPR